MENKYLLYYCCIFLIFQILGPLQYISDQEFEKKNILKLNSLKNTTVMTKWYDNQLSFLNNHMYLYALSLFVLSEKYSYWVIPRPLRSMRQGKAELHTYRNSSKETRGSYSFSKGSNAGLIRIWVFLPIVF